MARQTVRRAGLEDKVEVVTDLVACAGKQFDCISCLGVLEHMPLPQRELFHDLCERQLAPRGVGIIDVPVEFGPAVLVKELARRVLKARPSEYFGRELFRRVLGLRERDRER